MSSALYQYPQQAAFGRVLPKTKIYQHANPSNVVKALFVAQVEKITWRYKLAPETINLPARRSVPEIQLFEIRLKTPELKEEVLRCIDQAVSFPIIFELHYQNQIKLTAAYKRPRDADTRKWVVGSYLNSSWLANDTERTPLPVALDLASLYEQLLRPLLPVRARAGESLAEQISRYTQIQNTQKECDKIEAQLHKERQFNRRVDINAQLRTIQQELARLTA